MAPLISIGATMPVGRKPAMSVTVSQCPIGTSPIRRCPRGLQPLSRTMLVVTAVSSMNTRCAGSSSPCSRTQRRRARATSARFRSSARRLFFEGDAVDRFVLDPIGKIWVLSPTPGCLMSIPDPRPTLEAPDDDPYLWLEEIEGGRALAWVGAQNAVTLQRFGDACFAADRDALKAI